MLSPPKPKKEVFGGYVKNCLQHFAACFNSQVEKGSKNADKLRRPIAEFCGVETKTVARWFRSQIPPVGEVLVKLMCYLDMIGYRVMELEKLGRGHMVRRNFMELIGFGVLSSQKAAEIISETHPPNLYQVFWGMAGISDQREQIMWDTWKRYREELEQKKQESLRLRRPRFRLRIISKDGKIGQLMLIDKTTEPNFKKKMVSVELSAREKAAINIMEGLLGLLREGLFENLSEGKLGVLKQSPTIKTIVCLSARLSSLSLKLKPKSAIVDGGGAEKDHVQ